MQRGFTIAARDSPIAGNAVALEVRAEFQLSPNMAVVVDYSGQTADDARDHAVKAGFRLRF